MLETKTKYHHLVPRTYMSSWKHGKETLYIEYKDGKIKERNKDKIAGVTDFHSILVGMPICTKDDTDKIFSCLSDYSVEYDGRVVTDTLEMNQLYFDFDNWIITREDGTTVSKKKLRHDIDSVKIRDIEALWSIKYENGWNEMKKRIESEILKASSDIIPAFDREYLMKFYTAMDWRGFKFNNQLNEIFDWLCNKVLPLHEVKIPKDERELPMFETAADYFKHCYILKAYRQYLNDEGVIYINAMENLKNTSFHFLVADGVTTFITSDNPAFMFVRADGKLQGLMPVNPRILLVQGRDIDRDKVYCISHISDDAVKAYNNIICQNSKEFVIIDDLEIEHF